MTQQKHHHLIEKVTARSYQGRDIKKTNIISETIISRQQAVGSGFCTLIQHRILSKISTKTTLRLNLFNMKLQLSFLIATLSSVAAFTSTPFGVKTTTNLSTELEAERNGEKDFD